MSSLRRLVTAALADGQRGAQVVSDCGEQRRPHPVTLGDRDRGGGRLAEPVPLEDDGGLRGEGTGDALVLGAQRPSAQREHERVAGGHLGVGVLRALAPVRPGDGHHGPLVGGTAGRRSTVGGWRARSAPAG